MHVTLKPNGKKISFLKVGIGNPFFAHGRIWVCTSYEAATELHGTRGGMMASCCNFTIDEADSEVEEVDCEPNT